jgi:hypothetical protein
MNLMSHGAAILGAAINQATFDVPSGALQTYIFIWVAMFHSTLGKVRPHDD